jgi:LAO/AO transport system kinase
VTDVAVPDVGFLAAGIAHGDRRVLAQAITLIESTRAEHRQASEALLAALPRTSRRVMRIGITGAPGVGKSTLIEALGQLIVSSGETVAVLAVDPSSSRSGGSILGDKTRMVELSRNEAAFIRPSPAGSTLGGVARRTREAMQLVEAAGYRRVIVETVGVGQSETAVAGMTDVFVLVVAPAGGDQLQGIKRGIMELADLVVVNKADGDLVGAATRAASEYRGAIGLMIPRHPGMPASISTVSALEGNGVPELWDAIVDRWRAMDESDMLDTMRADQARSWLWDEVDAGLRARALARAGLISEHIEHQVVDGSLLPHLGAARLLDEVFGQDA